MNERAWAGCGQRYSVRAVRSTPLRVLLGIALLMLLLAGCGEEGLASLGEQPPTAVPFNRLNAQDVLNAVAASGISIQNATRDMLVGRGAPARFLDRYVFEIVELAPAGGQVIIFETPADLQAWQEYIITLRNDASTRRDVIYVYTHANVLLQLNANLNPALADGARQALEAL
jgi:hypothetical protein